MLLRDSEVAKTVRRYLLEVEDRVHQVVERQSQTVELPPAELFYQMYEQQQRQEAAFVTLTTTLSEMLRRPPGAYGPQVAGFYRVDKNSITCFFSSTVGFPTVARSSAMVEW
ncbi:hypothetical protein A5694_04500 [Mycolicibacter sinensis]|nr:hypothetical protein A5694_04500 [Mycolicibacter sinensis]